MSWWKSLSAAASKVQEVVVGEVDLLFGDEDYDDEVETHDFGDDDLAITPDIIDYVQAISTNAETFMQFPIARYKRRDAGFALSADQRTHAMKVLEGVPEFNTLRRRLIPAHMSENDFWLVYFLLLSNVTSYDKRKRGHTPRVIGLPPHEGMEGEDDSAEIDAQATTQAKDEAESILEAHFARNLIASPAELLDEGIHPHDDSYFTPPDMARHAHKHVMSPGTAETEWTPHPLAFDGMHEEDEQIG